MTIQVEHVTASAKGRRLLNDFNLEISSDTSYMITGEDEEAKTELIRIILGLDQPEQGRVRLLGDYKYSSVNAGVVFREDRLAEGFSAETNCAMVNGKLSERIAGEELDKLLAPGRSKVPVSELTREERRLVCIVRATLIPSDVILMDAPFEGMSEENRAKAIRYIREVKASTPLVLTTDRTDDLDWCKTVDIRTGIPLSM